jgi:hypothetical protein
MIIFLQLTSCLGAGDIFAEEERIHGQYYLLDHEGFYGICYKKGDNYIGRNPQFSDVVEYGISDSILLFRSRFSDSSTVLIGINMKLDDRYSEVSDISISDHQVISVYKKLLQKGLKKVDLPHAK